MSSSSRRSPTPRLEAAGPQPNAPPAAAGVVVVGAAARRSRPAALTARTQMQGTPTTAVLCSRRRIGVPRSALGTASGWARCCWAYETLHQALPCRLRLLVCGNTGPQGLVQLQLAGSEEGILNSVRLIAALPFCISLPVMPLGSRRSVIRVPCSATVCMPWLPVCISVAGRAA